jgi:hypothetical protein
VKSFATSTEFGAIRPVRLFTISGRWPEVRYSTETMPRRRNAQQEYPLVNVIRIKNQRLACDVDSRRLTALEEYIRYAEHETGEKPTPGEVVGVALEHLFKLDQGFQRWQEQHHKPDQRDPIGNQVH